jgi:hypothetical protein
MSIAEPALADRMATASAALQGVLGAILNAETERRPAIAPSQLLTELLTGPEWGWLQPLYALIADIDHALADSEVLPATEIAAIGGRARDLLARGTRPAEQAFVERYRSLLQTDPSVGIAHGRALQALRALPPESASEAERIRAHQQWEERRTRMRTAGGHPSGSRSLKDPGASAEVP